MLTAFDFPDVDASCEERFKTTQPGQALVMLNDEFINEQATKLAARVVNEVGSNPRRQIEEAIRLALNRSATDVERAEGLELINRMIELHGQQPEIALKYWCLAVLNLNEFIYLD